MEGDKKDGDERKIFGARLIGKGTRKEEEIIE